MDNAIGSLAAEVRYLRQQERVRRNLTFVAYIVAIALVMNIGIAAATVLSLGAGKPDNVGSQLSAACETVRGR